MTIDYLSTEWKILAIDDSKLNRAIIKNSLSQLNMEVDEAEDGLLGLDAKKIRKYDLVLVDIVMPRLDGFGFLAKYKELAHTEFIPVILMTGSDDLNSKIKGLRIGADDFLIKPLNEKELVARVLSLLRLKSAHDELYYKNQMIQKELESAKKVQQFIIPKEFNTITYPVIAARYLPIEDIGGDFYDVYELPDEKLGFLISDVTGHGIPAALVMTMSKMIFNLFATSFLATDKLLTRVNKEMRGLLLDTQYITSFYVIYDHKDKTIQFTNAGHTRALYYRQSKKRVMGLDTLGFFIGISDDTFYEKKSISVEKGDRLFLYTDGLTEVKNDDDEEYGDKRLAKFISHHQDLHSDAFCDALLEDIEKFTSLDERNDDVAFIAIEF
jgi:sigma-B regulation protein RsbU (phosphoserine phosphatase)